MYRQIVLIPLLTAYLTVEAQSIDVNQSKLQFQQEAPEIRNIRAQDMMKEYYKLQHSESTEALSFLKNIISIFPEFKLARLELISTLEKQGDALEAYNTALQAAKDFPDDFLIALSLGNCKSILGEEQQSVATFKKLTRSTNRYIASLAEEYLGNANARIQQMKLDIAKYYQLYEENIEQSQVYLDDLLKKYPLNYQLMLIKGLSLQKAHKDTEAMPYLKKAQASFSDSPTPPETNQALNTLVLEALKTFKSTSSAPDETTRFHKAMNDYYLTKKTNKILALKQLNDILQRYPNRTEPSLEMGYFLLGNNQNKAALPFLFTAKKLLSAITSKNLAPNTNTAQRWSDKSTIKESGLSNLLEINRLKEMEYALSSWRRMVQRRPELWLLYSPIVDHMENNTLVYRIAYINEQKMLALTTIRLLTLKGNYVQAYKLLGDYFIQYGSDKDYITEEARLMALTNHSKKALALIEPFLQKYPKNKTWLDIQSYALSHADKVPVNLIELSPEDAAAAQAVKAGDYAKAIPMYQQSLAKNPNNKNAIIGLERAYVLQGNYWKANKQLISYINKFGADEPYLVEKARLLALTNNSQQALFLINMLLTKDPTNKDYLAIQTYALAHAQSAPIDLVTMSEEDALAMAANREGDYPKAISLYQAAILKNPFDKYAYLGIEQAHVLQGNYTQASEQLAIYKNKFGEDAAYLTEKARLLALTNHSKEALVILKELLQNDPTNKVVLDIQNYAITHANGLSFMTKNPEFPQISQEDETATLAMNNDDYKKAISLYEQSLSKNPDDKYAILGLTRADILQGNYVSALRRLTNYKTKFGEDTPYFTEQARYFAFTNNPEQALATLRPLLQKDPTNDIFLDIKDYISSHPKEKQGAFGLAQSFLIDQSKLAKKYAQLASFRGNDPKLYIKAAEIYLSINSNKEALIMVNAALKLDPTNGDFVYLKAKIAEALGDNVSAYREYKKLYLTNRDNLDVILRLARSASNLGKLDESARLYAAYTKINPRNSKAWLEYAFIQSWRGNDRKALRVLKQYPKYLGITRDYLIARARIVASAARPTPALAIVNALLPKDKKNYDLLYAKITALYYNNQPVEMFKALAEINQINPKSQETKGLNAFIITPFRNNANLDLYHSFDTDTVKISRATLSSQYFLSPTTSLLGNFTPERLSATVKSGLNPVEGGTWLDLYTYNVGVNHRYNSHLGLQAFVGGANTTDGQSNFIYQGDAFISLTDTIKGGLQFKRSYYDQSPLAVSLGVLQNLNQIEVLWLPCIQCSLGFNTSYSSFTDGNTMKYASANAGLMVISSELLNVKLGVSTMWQGFSQQLSNGYYNPSNYRFHSAVADVYFKQSDNIGYQFTLGLGAQKDETFTKYKAANDYAAKAYFGIYQDWYLILTLATSTRGRGIANNPTIGTYQVTSFNTTLTRRF